MKKLLLILIASLGIGFGLYTYSLSLGAPCYVSQGCTGQTIVPQGSILYGSSTNQSLVVLATGSAGSILSIVNNVPAWISTSTSGLMPLSTGTTGYVANWVSPSNLSIGTLLDNGVAGVNATSSTVAFNIQGTDTVDPLQVGTSTNTSMLIVKGNTGRVGIGTTTPQAPLTIGTINGSTGISLQASGSGSLTNMMNIVNTGGNIKWGANSSSGAAITNGVAYSSFLVSGNSTALQLGSNNTAYITILSGGNVGINTTTPVAQLSVVGTAAISNTGNDRIFNFDSANGNISLTSASTPFMFLNRFNAATTVINGGGGKVGVGTSTTPTADLQVVGSGVSSATTGFEVFNLTGASEFKVRNDGRVGVNTATPDSTLQINQLANSGDILHLSTLNAGAGNASILFTNGTGIANLLRVGSVAGTGESWINSYAGLHFGTNLATIGSNERMTITTTGNVGIGSTSPISALVVNSNSLTLPTLIVQASSTQSSNAFEMRDNLGNVDFSVATSGMFSALYGFKTTGSTPTIATSTGVGTGGSATITGNDQLSHVTLVTGSAPPTSGAVFIITFSAAKPTTPYCWITHTSGATAGFAQYLASSTPTTFTLSAGGAAFTASQTSTYDVFCDHYQ